MKLFNITYINIYMYSLWIKMADVGRSVDTHVEVAIVEVDGGRKEKE